MGKAVKRGDNLRYSSGIYTDGLSKTTKPADVACVLAKIRTQA